MLDFYVTLGDKGLRHN